MRRALGLAALLAATAAGHAGFAWWTVLPLAAVLSLTGEGAAASWRRLPALAARGESGLWWLALAGTGAYALIACLAAFAAGALLAGWRSG